MVSSARRRLRRLLFASVAALLALPSATLRAEGRINGLVGVTTDYVFRGRSQTRGDPAWQAGIGYEHSSGLFGGVWASRVGFSSLWDHELEIDYVAGLGRDLHRGWWAEIALRRYTYPRSPDSLDYDYTEIAGTLRFRDLVTVSVTYAPGWSGYTSRGAVRSDRLLATELGLQYPLGHGFSATGGFGRLDIAGPAGGTPLYWNVGVAQQYRGLTIELSYYDTDRSARRLFGPDGVHGDVVAAIVYEF